MVILIPILISICILILCLFINKLLVLKIYVGLLCAATTAMFFLIKDYNVMFEPITYIHCLVSIFSIVIFYCSELLLANAVMNKMLILDYRFYFTGKVEFSKMLTSLPILIMEEAVFRLPIISALEAYPWLFCGITSLSFGLVHLFFSKQNMISKVFLGLLLGYTILISKNVYLVVLMHGTYNLLIFQDFKANKYVAKDECES